MAYAYALKMPLGEIVPLVLTAVLASIPVALPATFTLAAAIGAQALAHKGVLPTRLSAVDEAASIDVLCSDKTGTLTRNELKVTAIRPCPASTRRTCWDWPLSRVQMAGRIRWTAPFARPSRSPPAPDLPKLRSSCRSTLARRCPRPRLPIRAARNVRIVKGAFAAVMGLVQPVPDAARVESELEAQGFRVLAVAVGSPDKLKLAGIIALSDPPRTDSAALITELRALGVRTVMVTGDAPATAAIVARAVGLDGASLSTWPHP